MTGGARDAGVELVRATAADLDAVARTLGRAFEDDPVMAWLFPDPATRLASVTRFFAYAVEQVHLPHGDIVTAGAMASVAVWEPPGRWKVPLSTTLRGARAMVSLLGPRLPRSLRGLSAIESRHTRWPHWYLAIVGTDPEHQGRGLGAAVIRDVLSRCDGDGVGAYLESSKPENVPYYERFGFRVVDEVRLPAGPPVWLMWRHPERG
jgi:GNAT superfamily N-acetyltransferase